MPMEKRNPLRIVSRKGSKTHLPVDRVQRLYFVRLITEKFVEVILPVAGTDASPNKCRNVVPNVRQKYVQASERSF